MLNVVCALTGYRSVFRRHRLRRVWLPGLVATILSTMISVGTMFLAVPPEPALAQEADHSCEDGDSIRVLFLLDTSRSLQTNDPEGKRTTGTIDALEDLHRIANDYRARLRQYYPRWSVLAAVDTFSGHHSDPLLSNPYSRRSGPWQDLYSPNGLDRLRRSAQGLQQVSGYWTDYREALGGVIERFAEPVLGATPSCDFLFWFTDGNHDTVTAGVLTDDEREQIDGMCSTGGLVNQLRQAEVNVTAIELRVDRESSDQLRRLVVGREADCSGLGGKVADVASVGDLAARMEDTVFRLVDPDFPDEFEPCDSVEEYCDFRFTLAGDIEWIKVYVDLTDVDDPGGASAVLQGPNGQPTAPIRFGEEWSLIANTGILGSHPTSNLSVIWAHQVSRQTYGTRWGNSQIWTIRFSGPQAERARAGISIDKRGRPAIQEMRVSEGDLSGRIIPPPIDGEDAMVVLHLGDGRYVDVPSVERRVRAGGRFVIPDIVDRVTGTTGGDDYLASNACAGVVVVSLEKAIDYGPFSGTWNAPLSNSAADVGVPRALCGLEGRKTPSPTLVELDSGDPFDPSGSLRMTADGGLLDGALSVREVHVEVADGSTPGGGVLGAWAQDWRCDVAADARDQACENPFELDLSANSAVEVDVRLVFSASTTDPLQDPQQPDLVSYVVRGIHLDSRLPKMTGAEVSEQFDPSGSLLLTAQGGWQDGILSLDPGSGGISVTRVDGSTPQLRPDSEWHCEVPAEAARHECPSLNLDVNVEDDTVMDLLVSVRSASADPAWTPTEEQSTTVEDLSVRTRSSGEIRRNILPYLVVLAVVFVLMRVLAAWMRRRWKPLPQQQNLYHVATARREGGRMVPDGVPRTVTSNALTQASASAVLGSARLHVRWWPLLRGGPVEVVASPTGGQQVVASSGAERGSRRTPGMAGRIGRDLAKGWVALGESGGGQYTLIFWDAPDENEVARAQELWDKVGAVLSAQEAKETPPSRQAAEGEPSSSSPPDTPAKIDPRKGRPLRRSRRLPGNRDS